MCKTVLFNIAADPGENLGEANYLFATLLQLQKTHAAEIASGDLEIRTMRLNFKSQSEDSDARTNNMPINAKQLMDETPIYTSKKMADVMQSSRDEGARIVLFGHGKSTLEGINDMEWIVGLDALHLSTHEVTPHMAEAMPADIHLHTDGSTASLVKTKYPRLAKMEIHAYGKMPAATGSASGTDTGKADYEAMLKLPERIAEMYKNPEKVEAAQKLQQLVEPIRILNARFKADGKFVAAVSSAGWRHADKSAWPVTEAETYSHGAYLARIAMLQGYNTAIVVLSPGPRVEIDQEAGHDSFGAYVQGVQDTLNAAKATNHPVIVLPFVRDSGFNAINAMNHLGSKLKIFEVNAENFNEFDTSLEEKPRTTEVWSHRINQLIDSKFPADDTRHHKQMAGANKGMTILVGPCELMPTDGGMVVKEVNPYDPVPLKDKTPAQRAALRAINFTAMKTGAARPERGYDPTVEMVEILARDFAPSASRPSPSPLSSHGGLEIS